MEAGDTLYISGGSSSKTYREKWSVGASGTSANPITIAVDAANTNHNGLVIFDFDSEGDSGIGTCITVFPQRYVTIDGNVDGKPHIAINNLRNTNWNHYYDATAIDAYGSTGVILKYLACTNGNVFVAINVSTGFQIHNCSVSENRGVATILCNASYGSWDSQQIYSNYFGRLFNETTPEGSPNPYYGPDGIQCGDGISIWANTFYITKSESKITSPEHPDTIQCIGERVKIYGNEFIMVGDAVVDRGGYDGVDGLWVYNNVFRIIEEIDTFPEYIRVYNGNPPALKDIKILNNTFVDNPWIPIWFSNLGGPTGEGIEVKNNIFNNCGRDQFRPVILIDDSCGYTADSFGFDGNIYFCPSNQAYVSFGADYPVSTWVSRFEPHGKTNAPVFVEYSPFGAGNNLHLSGSDTAAVNAGVQLSSYFGTDKDGILRPQGPGWDIGAYQSGVGGVLSTNLAPAVSVISQDAADVDPNAPGVQILEGTAVRYSGTASDPNGDPLIWQWIYTVNGGPEGVFQSGTGAVAAASFNYGAGTAGNIYVWKLRVRDGKASSESQFTVEVVSGPRAVEGLSFEAELGVVTAPFILTNGYIYQPVQTDGISGGRAAYDFTITNAGSYVIKAVVDGPGYGEWSLYVNIDSEPQGPEMVWQIPITIGFESRIISWQGNGTCVKPQFAPKVFNLSEGAHQLIIRGREANTRLDQIALAVLPEVTTLAATEITGTGATLNGSVNPLGSVSSAYFEYGPTTNYDDTTPATSVGNGTTFRAVSDLVTGLTPRTVYNFRLVAYNASIAHYGANQTFTTAPPPPTLADTGSFADLVTLQPKPGVMAYDINVPFWSDHARKTRWFSVPDTNSFIGFNSNGNWSFPAGTLWIEHFDLELTNGVAQSARRLETRFLVRNSGGVYGITYRWDDSQTNAFLVPKEGLDEPFVIHDVGTTRTQIWHYPARSECLTCHTPDHSDGFVYTDRIRKVRHDPSPNRLLAGHP